MAEAVRREVPDLEVETDDDGLRWRVGSGPFQTVTSKNVRRVAGAKARGAEAGRSYFDETTGTLRLVAPGVLIHLRTDVRVPKLTPLECCLTATLVDAGEEASARLLAGPTNAAARWFTLTCGTPVLDMTASRLKRTLNAAGVARIARGTTRFDRAAACERIGEDFRLDAVGPELRFRAADPDAARMKLAQLPGGGALEGVSAVVLESGAYVDERDFVADRAALPEIERLLGPALRRSEREGATVAVRPAQRLPAAVLADRTRPGRVHRLLAIADLRRRPGALAEIGENLWRNLLASL